MLFWPPSESNLPLVVYIDIDAMVRRGTHNISIVEIDQRDIKIQQLQEQIVQLQVEYDHVRWQTYEKETPLQLLQANKLACNSTYLDTGGPFPVNLQNSVPSCLWILYIFFCSQ